MFYIGRFPKPLGGVTIKNDLIYKSLQDKYKCSITKFNTSILKTNPILGYVKLIHFILSNKNDKGFIGVSSKSLIILLVIINFVSPKVLMNTKVFVMGGNIHKYIKIGWLRQIIKKVNVLYVEVENMKGELNKIGISNVKVIPNCRIRPQNRTYKPNLVNDKFKCLFLSRITEEKGIDTILQANEMCMEKKIDIEIDFYGPIDNKLENDFLNQLKSKDNLRYKGQINSNELNIYSLISEYNVLLFPTRYKGEGFPGVLTEAKIAGVPVIASNWIYNPYIIKNNYDGIIIKPNSEIELVNAIEKMIHDKELTEKLRRNSYDSAKKYFIDEYIEEIFNNWERI